jgi:hypothetical protein
MSIARTLCFTLLALSSLAARATTVTVDHDVLPTESLSGIAFDADPGRGQAWVVVKFVNHGGEEEQVDSRRLSVPGLTYDVATRTINLQDGDRNVTCAVARKVLWVTRFSPTQQCPISVHQVPEKKVQAAVAGGNPRLVVEVGTGR